MKRMKTILIILLIGMAGVAKGQSIDKIVNDLVDAKIKIMVKDTVLYVGKGIKLDTANGRAVLNVDPAYIIAQAKTIPIDGYNLIMLLRSVPTMTTTQRNLLKPTENKVIYNSTTNTYQIYQGGVWR